MSIDWDEIREVRNLYLEKSDKYVQITDYPIAEADLAEWKVYRQTLRDLPEDQANAEEVIFPTPPLSGYKITPQAENEEEE